MFGQEVRFPSAILSAGGSSEEGSSINLSKWRIGQVHVLTLPEEESIKKKINEKDFAEQNWYVNAYPNPVKDFLYLEFELPESRELLLKITDAAGRVIFIQEARPFINGSIIELNMSRYIPALYLLQIFSPDLTSQQVYCIQKL